MYPTSAPVDANNRAAILGTNSVTGAAQPIPAQPTGGLAVDNIGKLAGEDLVADRMLVEERNQYAYLSASTTTVLKTGTGLLHSITITNPSTSSVIAVYDNTAGSGSTILYDDALAVGTLLLDVAFSIGLTIVVTGATAPRLTVSYR